MIASAWIVALLLTGLAIALHVRELRMAREAERTWCQDSNCLCFGTGPALSIDAARHRRPERDALESVWMTLDLAEAERDMAEHAEAWQPAAAAELSALAKCPCDDLSPADRIALADHTCPGCSVPYGYRVGWTLS